MNIKRIRPHVNPFSMQQRREFEGFENDHPIWVDVGAFKGEFIHEMALKYPEKNFIVFEIRLPLYRRLCELFSDMSNVRVFDGDAGLNFRSILEPSIARGVLVENIFVNFPDPWLKDRHKKRRFVNEKFLASTQDWIRPETNWVFQTDQKPVFEDTLETLRNLEIVPEFFEGSFEGVPTDWEKAKLAAGDEIHRMRFGVGR